MFVCLGDEFVEWHKKKSIMDDYDLCGVNSLPINHIWGRGVFKCHGEMETFFYGTNCYQKWGGKKKLKFVYKSIDSSELLEYMKPKLQFFVHHNFVARWQDMIKYCLENFPNDVVVFVIDFTRYHSSDIRNACIFRRCSKKSIFKYLKIWKCEYVKYMNTMSKTSKLSLSCAQTLLNQLEHRHTLNKIAH
jgi:hypothetical protein